MLRKRSSKCLVWTKEIIILKEIKKCSFLSQNSRLLTIRAQFTVEASKIANILQLKKMTPKDYKSKCSTLKIKIKTESLKIWSNGPKN